MKKTKKKVAFKSNNDSIYFEYHDTPPEDIIQFRIKDEQAYKINASALQLYFLYRKTLQNSCAEKKEKLAKDIQEFPKNFFTHPKTEDNNLRHYSANVALSTVLEWIEQKKPVQCYIAYKHTKDGPIMAGFVHFYREKIDDKDVVYISQAGVALLNAKIGTRLMKLVLAHFEEGTEFYILTRKFNTEAIGLYNQKLGFTDIKSNEISQLGYDQRYVGFKHTTSFEEIKAIQDDCTPFKINYDDTPSFKDAAKILLK